jgi:hypothetical protein
MFSPIPFIHLRRDLVSDKGDTVAPTRQAKPRAATSARTAAGSNGQETGQQRAQKDVKVLRAYVSRVKAHFLAKLAAVRLRSRLLDASFPARAPCHRV